jgi:hypothetical protein
MIMPLAKLEQQFQGRSCARPTLKTGSDAKHPVLEYIEVYYNRKQLHSKRGYLSPAFEAKKVA